LWDFLEKKKIDIWVIFVAPRGYQMLNPGHFVTFAMNRAPLS
jgi:hypothetical protein